MLNNTVWTDERVIELKGLWDSGWSCADIAAKLGGITRNAVIGKVNRLGLDRRRSCNLRAVKPKQQRAPRQLRPNFKRFDDLFSVAAPIGPTIAEFVGISFAETTTTTCMYPEGDGAHMLFCGQPRKDESSYCPAHHAICHQKPTGPTARYWKTWGRAA